MANAVASVRLYGRCRVGWVALSAQKSHNIVKNSKHYTEVSVNDLLKFPLFCNITIFDFTRRCLSAIMINDGWSPPVNNMVSRTTLKTDYRRVVNNLPTKQENIEHELNTGKSISP